MNRSQVEVSVCMATYNGEPFIRRQIESILVQLADSDELIVVDDGSTDGTVAYIQSLEDRRITLVCNSTNLGHVGAFERAIGLARGEVVMLSDQDDYWPRGRIDVFVAALANANVAASSLSLVSRTGERVGAFVLRGRARRWPFIDAVALMSARRAYFGCAMAFRRTVSSQLLPFPPGVEAHDHWLAIVGSIGGGVNHVEAITVERTLHERNLTPTGRRNMWAILRTRLIQSYLVGVAMMRAVSR